MKADKVLFLFSSVHKTQYVAISLSLRNKPMEMFWLSGYCTIIELVL